MCPSRGELFLFVVFVSLYMFPILCLGQTDTAEPDTCGTRFLIPYPVETAKCDVSVEIVPQVLNITQVNITASFMNNNLSLSYEIAPNTSLVVPLNFTNFQSNEGPDEKAIGLLLRSSDNVCVMYGRQRGDRSQLYPTDAFGTDYVIMTPSTTINMSSTVFVMPQGVPGVLTNITLTVNSNSSLCELFTCGYGDTEFNFTIKSNEVLMLEDGNLMDGVRLNADRPVGVLVGGITTDDPRNGTVCLEPTISTTEMLPPINTWGKMFVAVPLTPEIPVTLKITGETNVTVYLETSVSSYDIKDSAALQLNFVNDCYIMLKSARPIQIMYITNVTSSDERAMYKNDFILPPLEQYIGYQAFSLKKQHNASTLVAISPSALGDESLSQVWLDYYTNETATRVYKLTQENVTVTRVGNLQGTYHSILDMKINTSYGILYDADRSSFSVLGMRLTSLNRQCQPNNSSRNSSALYDRACGDWMARNNDSLLAGSDASGTGSTGSVKNCVHEDERFNIPSRFSVKARNTNDHAVDTTLSSNIVAVIVSLSVALLAVCAVISSFVLIELISRRKQLRSTKIRPFVS